MIKNKIKNLQSRFKKLNIDGYIVPKNDEFFSEYDQNNRLKNISNFSGSAGFAIILKNKKYLFVDGRYTIQAKKESSKYFKIIELHKKLPFQIIKKCKLGFDPKLFTSEQLMFYFQRYNELIPIKKNLVDSVCFKTKKKTKPFFSLDKSITGESRLSKINKIIKYLKKNKTDFLFISAPENVAWILNIRGYDNPTSPIPNCRLIIKKNKELYLIANNENCQNIIKQKIIAKNQLINSYLFESLINKIKGKNFIIDNKSCSIFHEKIIKSKFKIKNKDDPVYNLKSIKNTCEINHMIQAHNKDGLALTRFIFWLKNINKKKITEVDAQNKLEKFRKYDKDYLFPSFNTIAGAGSNGAIVHYRATKNSTKIINKKDIFLCDSGGQYNYGTTDVTRTISFSKPKKIIKDIYTKVLKGHIAVAQTNLQIDNTGNKIDKRARKFLKGSGLDYAHGTGHGVGFFLNVHEGPQSISKHNTIKIKKGMILSNEPGFYKEGYFGIRIENLVYVKKTNKKIYFENLTFAPMEKNLINFKMLSQNEKNYLFKYHLNIYSKYSKFLSKPEKNWLASLI
jgi:Xaa-Pro aminopeptidase